MNLIKIFKLVLITALTFAAFLLILIIIIKLPYGNDDRKVNIIIEDGSSANRIASQLEDEDLIILKEIFLLHLKVSGKGNSLNAGKYIIEKPISINEIMNLLVLGKSEPRDINVTIPEGSTIIEISQLLVDHDLDAGNTFTNESFMKADYNDLWILSDLEDGESLEGFLFPDTYGFLPEMTSSDMIRLMVENLQEKLSTVDLDNSSYTFQNIKKLIIFSSIVQKESPLDDMDLIAGVICQ